MKKIYVRTIEPKQQTEEQILYDFFTLVAEKNWFRWVDELEGRDYRTELQVDEELAESFEEFAQGHFEYTADEIDNEIHENYMRSIGAIK